MASDFTHFISLGKVSNPWEGAAPSAPLREGAAPSAPLRESAAHTEVRPPLLLTKRPFNHAMPIHSILLGRANRRLSRIILSAQDCCAHIPISAHNYRLCAIACPNIASEKDDAWEGAAPSAPHRESALPCAPPLARTEPRPPAFALIPQSDSATAMGMSEKLLI